MAVLNGWCDEAPAGYIEPHSALFLKNASEGAKELLKEGKLKTLQELSAAAPDTSPIARPPLSTEKLDGPDLHDRLLASTLMVGLYPGKTETRASPPRRALPWPRAGSSRPVPMSCSSIPSRW
jgi:hypothetical protein